MTTKENNINIRELSLNMLMEILEEGKYSNTIILNKLRNYQYLEKQDRAFLTRLTEGVIERLIELDYVIDAFSKVKVKKQKPVIRNILRMGVYQIKYMSQVPARAACNEAVKLANKKGFSQLKGFVNGVLRNIARNIESITYPDRKTNRVKYFSVTYSMPEWIVSLWLDSYGEAITEKMLISSLEEKKTTIRCNNRNGKKEELKKRLETKGVIAEDGVYAKEALKISNYNYIDKLPGFYEGDFSVQDESSMMVGIVSGVKENVRVIDVCAAPGGKSLHISELMNGTGMISARDISENKVEIIDENIERLHAENIKTKVWNAEKTDTEWVDKADLVIADLPCSGLGVLGKKNDIKYKTSEKSIEELSGLQRKILTTVSSYVKRGGELIYSTCTVNLEENDKNVRWFLENYGEEFEPVSLNAYLPENLQCEQAEKGYLQLFPGVHNTDGFFLAKFRRK